MKCVEPRTTSENYQFLIKLNKHLSYDPAILILGIYPGEKKICPLKICTIMYTAALFSSSKLETILISHKRRIENILWYIQTYNTIQNNRDWTTGKHNNLDISQKECAVQKKPDTNSASCLISFIWSLRTSKTKSMDREIRTTVPTG